MVDAQDEDAAARGKRNASRRGTGSLDISDAASSQPVKYFHSIPASDL